MKDSLFPSLISGLLCLVFLLLPLPRAAGAEATEPASAPIAPVSEAAAEAVQPEDRLPPFDAATSITLRTADGMVSLPLDEYLTGVLLAEMPADFPAAALQAQAIAARTFTLQKINMHKHPDADICADSACCQGWLDPEGADCTALREAVQTTDGLVVTYDGALIDATFFSCDGGRTESALAVWGSDVAYLQAVESPESEDSGRYAEEKRFSEQELLELLRSAQPELTPGDAPWFRNLCYTDGGGLASATVGGVMFRGTELRKLLGLRSTDMEISQAAGYITVSTQGFGHRVGLSQYGAKAMAEEGADFAEILTHYYQGTALRRLVREDEEPAARRGLGSPYKGAPARGTRG